MAKKKTIYHCAECGAQYPKWQGYCSQCGTWNSIEEEEIVEEVHEEVDLSRLEQLTN